MRFFVVVLLLLSPWSQAQNIPAKITGVVVSKNEPSKVVLNEKTLYISDPSLKVVYTYKNPKAETTQQPAYILLSSDKNSDNPARNLTTRVNYYIGLGYRPLGPPYAVFDHYGNIDTQCQAMIIGNL